MEKTQKKYHRIALKDIHAAPADGIYITKQDARQWILISSIFCILLGILSVFTRKK